jgi:flagella basal body P-ring formation protein FlgA
MKALATLLVLATSAVAQGAPAEELIRAQLAPALPPGSDIAKIYLPAKLAALDLQPDELAIELPRELRVGRRSVKVSVRGERPLFVAVSIMALVDVAIAERPLAVGSVITAADVRIETRAADPATPTLGPAVIGAKVRKPIAANAAIGATSVVLPPPLPRGTQVTVEIRRGAVTVRGAGTLELVARPGDEATVRLAHNKLTLRGTLVAPATVVVKGTP